MHLRLAHSDQTNTNQTAHQISGVHHQPSASNQSRLDLSALSLKSGVNQIRLRVGGQTLCMSLPNNECELNNLTVAVVPTTPAGTTIEVELLPQSKQTEAAGLTISLTDGLYYITADQAKLLGGFIEDIAQNYDDTCASDPVILRQTTSRIFDALLELSQYPGNENKTIKPSNVFDLLELSMYIGNDKTVKACQHWLLDNISANQATKNMPLFIQRIESLIQLPEHNWADTIIRENNNTVTLPGFLKEILIMAFPKTPLFVQPSDQGKTLCINELYDKIAKKTQPEEPLKIDTIEFPDVSPDLSYPQRELLRCMSTNALVALTELLERKENHDKFGIFTTFNERKDLRETRNIKQFPCEHSNLLCDAIYEALAKSECERTHFEVLDKLLTTVVKECGPTTLEKTLQSPRGISLVQVTAQANDDRALELLLKFGASAKNSGLLSVFAAKGNIKAIELLLNNGASANEGLALLNAIEGQHLPIVKRLLQSGAKLTGKRYVGEDNPLNAAARSGNTNMIEFLHSAGAKINHIHHRRWVELVPEAYNGRVYLDNDGNTSMLRVRRESKATPLMIALAHGHIDAAQKLLALGADPGLVPTSEHIVFSAVTGDCANRTTNAILCLLEHDRNLLDELPHDDAAYALKIAAKKGHHNLIRLLQTSPAFTTDRVRKHRNKHEFQGQSAFDLYRKQQNKQPDVLRALKPARIGFSFRK